MTHQSKIAPFKDAGIALLFAVLAVSFSGLCEPWLSILCGAASAIRLSKFDIRASSFLYIAILCVSFMEGRSWFLGASTIAFGISGLLATWIFQIPTLPKIKIARRIIEILPALLILLMMPLPVSIFSTKAPKRGIIDAGVWAKSVELPKGEEALSTKYQYGYEQFKTSQKAEIVFTHQSLNGFDELILITPTTPFDDKFSNDLADWTSKGGRLLIVADHTNLFGHQTVLKKIVDKFGIGIRPDAVFETKTNGGTYSNLLDKFVGLTPCSISKGVIPRLRMEGWSEHPNYTAPSFFGKMDPSNDDQWGHHTVLGSRRHGLGEVSIFSDSTFFANFAINRWSSNILEASLFWNRTSSIMALVGLLALLAYLKKPLASFLALGVALVIISPSMGFTTHVNEAHSISITLAPPESITNSEEREKGFGSSLFASAYAFDIGIRWDNDAALNFKDTLLKNGIALKPVSESAELSGWEKFPTFEIEQILNNRFYIDENSFWFSQGVGPVRAANMANCWKTFGAKLPGYLEILTVISLEEKIIQSADGTTRHSTICNLPGNWVIFDDRIVGRWIPQSSKWLVRKEWQLGPLLQKDMMLSPAQ